jgi:hypothetical protein
MSAGEVAGTPWLRNSLVTGGVERGHARYRPEWGMEVGSRPEFEPGPKPMIAASGHCRSTPDTEDP